MEITYTIGPEDLWQYNMFVVKRVPAFRLRFLSRLIIVPVSIGLLFYSQGFSGALSLLVGFCVAGIWVPFCFWSSRRFNLKVINDRPGLLGHHVLKLRSDGLHQSSEDTESVRKWAAFSEIVQSPTQILFFVNNRYAVIVPKHAFLDGQAATLFYETAVNLWKNRHRVEAPLPSPPLPEVWPPPPRREG